MLTSTVGRSSNVQLLLNQTHHQGEKIRCCSDIQSGNSSYWHLCFLAPALSEEFWLARLLWLFIKWTGTLFQFIKWSSNPKFPILTGSTQKIITLQCPKVSSLTPKPQGWLYFHSQAQKSAGALDLQPTSSFNLACMTLNDLDPSRHTDLHCFSTYTPVFLICLVSPGCSLMSWAILLSLESIVLKSPTFPEVFPTSHLSSLRVLTRV